MYRTGLLDVDKERTSKFQSVLVPGYPFSLVVYLNKHISVLDVFKRLKLPTQVRHIKAQGRHIVFDLVTTPSLVTRPLGMDLWRISSVNEFFGCFTEFIFF